MIVQDIIFGEEFMVKNSMGMLSTFPSPRVEAMNRFAAKPVACLLLYVLLLNQNSRQNCLTFLHEILMGLPQSPQALLYPNCPSMPSINIFSDSKLTVIMFQVGYSSHLLPYTTTNSVHIVTNFFLCCHNRTQVYL